MNPNSPTEAKQNSRLHKHWVFIFRFKK